MKATIEGELEDIERMLRDRKAMRVLREVDWWLKNDPGVLDAHTIAEAKRFVYDLCSDEGIDLGSE